MSPLLLFSLVLALVILLLVIQVTRSKPRESFEASCDVLPYVDCPVPLTFSRQYTLDEWNRTFCKNATTSGECCQTLQRTMQNNCEMAKRNASINEVNTYRQETTSALSSYNPGSCQYSYGRDIGQYNKVSLLYRPCHQPVCKSGFLLASHMSETPVFTELPNGSVYVKYEVIDKCYASPELIQQTCNDKLSLFKEASQASKDLELKECKAKTYM